MMSHPTFMRTPASTASGIGSTYRPRPSTSPRRSSARSAPDTRVRPPARMLVTVPMVAPAPGSAPKSPATMLPIPWPTSSRFGSWRVPVSESAMREVRRLSTEPSRARMSAGSSARSRKPADGSPICTPGRPVGTAPMTGAESSHSTPTRVPATRATRRLGTSLASRRGHSTATARVTAATANASAFTLAIASGNAATAPIGPPGAVGAPRNGMAWIRMMMMPMPDMNPETTTYGV